jgi:hypothetical protein
LSEHEYGSDEKLVFGIMDYKDTNPDPRQMINPT